MDFTNFQFSKLINLPRPLTAMHRSNIKTIMYGGNFKIKPSNSVLF